MDSASRPGLFCDLRKVGGWNPGLGGGGRGRWEEAV